MQAKAVWIAHLDDYHLLGLKFARHLSTDAAACFREVEKSWFCGVNYFSYLNSVSEWHFGAMPVSCASAISSL